MRRSDPRQNSVNGHRPQPSQPRPLTDEEKALRAANLAQAKTQAQQPYNTSNFDPSSYAPARRTRTASPRYARRNQYPAGRRRVQGHPQNQMPQRSRNLRDYDKFYDEYENYEEAGLRKYRQGRKLTMFVHILTVLILLGSIAITYLMVRYHVLPLFHRIIALAVLFILNLLMLSIARRADRSGTARLFGIVFGVPCLGVVVVACYFLFSIIGFLSGINTAGRAQVSQMQVLVLKDSEYQSIEDIKDLSVAAPLSTDRDPLKATIAKIKDDIGVELNITEVSSYNEAANKLYDGEVSAILMNKAYVKNIEQEDHPNFSTETRSIYDYLYLYNRKETVKRVNTSEDSFVMYISGIDTYGEIESISRSDVNILISVNPQTHKILLTNIPRDTYLPIADGGQDQGDKLTHAGLYGVHSSVHTLENFLGVDINYYSRVNFTSLIDVVDSLDGITIDNPTEFTAYNGMYFPAGEINLNGEEALAFSRERNSLSDGDNDRGRNQQRVLTAIIRKAASPAVITNFNGVLSTFSDTCETDMPVEDIMKLVNKQIADDPEWQIESNALTGTGSVGELRSYAMPEYDLYMMRPDPDSKDEIIDAIRTVLQP